MIATYFQEMHTMGERYQQMCKLWARYSELRYESRGQSCRLPIIGAQVQDLGKQIAATWCEYIQPITWEDMRVDQFLRMVGSWLQDKGYIA